MLFQFKRGGHGTCAGTGSGGGAASRRTSSGPGRNGAIEGPNNHFINELGKWSHRAEENYDCGRWNGTKPDYDYLEWKWRRTVSDHYNYHDSSILSIWSSVDVRSNARILWFAIDTRL